MSNNTNVILLALPDQMSEVKATEEAAHNIEFLSILQCSVNSLLRSLVVVYLKTLVNLGL